MGAIITEKMGFFNVDNFISAIKNVDQMVYVFIGKDDSWASGDLNPPDPIIAVSREMQDSVDIVSMKRIFYSDISYIVKKNSWTEDTVYDQYTDDADLSTLTYFVESDNHVFKCISNNGGAESTVDPASSANYKGYTKTTPDNYVWKYMYTIVDTLTNVWNWSNDVIENTDGQDWMPAKDIKVRTENPDQWDEMQSAVAGDIHSFNITPADDPSLITHLVSLDGKEVKLQGNSSGFTGSFRATEISVGSGTYRFVIDVIGTGLSAGKDYNLITAVEINGNTTDSGGKPYINYIKPIFSPLGGHGSNPIRELGGEFVLIKATVDSFVGIYRKMGLIVNPLRKTKSDGTLNTINHIDDTGELVVGERIGKEDVEDTTIDDDYLRYSGDIIYIENLDTPKQLEDNSGVEIKMVLSF